MQEREVLAGGSDRPPRTSRRQRRALLLAVALTGGAVWAGPAALERREQARAERAASAAADAVHLVGSLRTAYGAEDVGSGLLAAEVVVDADGQERQGDVLLGVRWEGEGLLADGEVERQSGPLPWTLRPQARLDCAASRAGDLPDRAHVVLTVRARSGRDHDQRLPVAGEQLREGVLQACDLPDPDAEPHVEASAQGDRLVVLLEGVPRADEDLELRAVAVPGFRVQPEAGLALPHRLPPDTAGLYGFRLEVASCPAAAAARAVVVRLAEGGRADRRVLDVDSQDLRQPQPGSQAVSALLERLRAGSCP